MKSKNYINIAYPLQILLVKRWVNSSLFCREALTPTFKRYSKFLVDDIFYENSLLKWLKTPQEKG